MTPRTLIIILAPLLCLACSADPPPLTSALDMADAFAGCDKGALEADFSAIVPLNGPGIDPATGQIRPPGNGGYVVSTTYLQLKPGAATEQRIIGLMGPITTRLGTQTGLVGVGFGSATACTTARTLAIWRDKAAMTSFFMSPEHTAAISAVREVGRGFGATTNWIETDPAAISWQSATQHLKAVTGRSF